MKVFVALPLFISFSAMAALNCPAGSEVILKCLGVDQPEDQVVASEFMDDAVVCQNRQGLSLVLGAEGEAFPRAVPVREIARMGATSYQATVDGLEMNLVRTITGTEVNGKFTVLLAGTRATRSLSCR